MVRYEILCFGDSNTWGTIPRWEESELPSERYDENTRWTRVAAKLLGPDYHLIEEGLGGRTSIYSLPGEPERCGLPYLLPCILSHRPLDLVVLMLGTNDLRRKPQPDLEHLGDGVRQLIGVIQSTPKCGRGFRPPQILLAAPTAIRPADPRGRVGVYEKFSGEAGRRLSLAFPQVYRQVAEELGCHFLNAADYACASAADGVHFTAESHVALGGAMAEAIRQCLAGL